MWDLVAIELAVYSKGESPAMIGVDVAPHLPVEELFFITFLCYIAGVFHGLFMRLLGHRAASTYADALEIASDAVGKHPAITFLRGPGLALGDVR